jgi:hypothetical protein
MTQPTQTRHPWRAVTRTVVAAIPAAIGLLILLPDIARQAGIAQVGWVAGALTVVAAITRVLAMPAVNEFLRRHVPGLAAQPPYATGGPVAAGQAYIVGNGDRETFVPKAGGTFLPKDDDRPPPVTHYSA